MDTGADEAVGLIVRVSVTVKSAEAVGVVDPGT